MSKPESKPLSIVPLIAGAVAVAALLGFAFWRMSAKTTAPAATTETTAAAPAQQQPPAADEEAAKALVPRISVDVLRDRLAKNEITLIDVRDADSYLQAHIPGAMHIPLARVDGEIPYLPKGKPIVTYCT